MKKRQVYDMTGEVDGDGGGGQQQGNPFGGGNPFWRRWVSL
jgi:DnaJ-class molecular chaperone